MNPSEFISEYLECFGSGAPLPLAVIYTDKPLGSPEYQRLYVQAICDA